MFIVRANGKTVLKNLSLAEAEQVASELIGDGMHGEVSILWTPEAK